MMTNRERDAYTRALNIAHHEGFLAGQRAEQPRFWHGVLVGFAVCALISGVTVVFW